MDALELRWELAKCLVPVKPQDAKVLLFELEERLSSLGRQPSLGYPYYELSLCYGLLGMGSECRAAYSKAASSETAMGHYAPPVRRDAVIAGFCARFYSGHHSCRGKSLRISLRCMLFECHQSARRLSRCICAPPVWRGLDTP